MPVLKGPIVIRKDGTAPEELKQVLFTSPKKRRKKKLYTREELEEMSFKELKAIGKEFGVTDRSKSRLIEEILAAQNR